ncbi:hypothetical protein KBC75_04850 [Candidatus Shapirobacteria bacterium]|nr:hypothetical protein [Candidatus Shapirobacteria bacterium]
MSRIINFIKKYHFEIFIFSVVLILCLCNYTPGTFLTGWDNLHPEFNILANIKRSIFSTWQESQGLGLLAGMAHASDLVRQLIILPFTFILPTSLIRYLWHFSMLFTGTFGVFYLSLYITKNKYSSLIASLFYLLNFATVQYFHLPFEPYSTFWGFFPWLIYELFIYLDNPKSLKKLFLINLLATPSFYVQTLFVVYLLCVGITLLLRVPVLKNIKIVMLILAVNSFWLLPNIYFTLTQVSVTQNSMQNLMVTDQFIEQNIYRGNLGSFALLEGQYFDIKRHLGDSDEYIMQVWHQQYSQPLTIAISIFFISLVVLSLFSQNKYNKYFIGILLFGLIGFLCDTIPFNFVNHLFRQTPIVNQVFRNSFTKLLVSTTFSMSVLIGISLSQFKKINLLLIPAIILLSLPSFSGNFISPTMRVKIPDEYFALFQYLKNQNPSARIVDLPQYNYWGWYNHSWDYTGSGFLWYGIDQPITSRTFDVWSDKLENFYWQLHYTLNKQDPEQLSSLLNKYNVTYLLFDDSLFFPEAKNSGKVTLENQKIIDNLPNITLEKKFGKLKLYKIATPEQVYITKNTPSSQPSTSPHPNTIFPTPANPFWSVCTNLSNNSLISATDKESVVFIDCGKELPLNQNYVIKVIAKNILGRPLLYKIFSLQDNRLIVDSKLLSTTEPQYIYISDSYEFDMGLGINFSSLSLSDQPSINQLVSVEISPTNTNYYESLITPLITETQTPKTVYHPNQSFYKVTFNETVPGTNLVLPQSFNSGWLAFYFDNHRPVFLKDHVLVNNWSNGWSIPESRIQFPVSIYIFFWPQLLEFLGLLLIPITFIWLFQHH